MSKYHDKVVGLSNAALEKIVSLREQMKPGSVQVIPSGETVSPANSDAVIPLQKYVWLGEEDTATVEWLNHMIAEFQERRDRIIEHGGGEIFREYLQHVGYSPDGSQYFLGIKHGPDTGSLSEHPIKELNWSDVEIGKAKR